MPDRLDGMPDPLDPAVLVDPFGTWARQRARDAVHHDARSGTFVVLGYREAVEALRNPAFSAAQGQARRGTTIAMPPSMLNTDGEQHARLRAPAGPVLGPGAVRDLVRRARADIEAEVDRHPLTEADRPSVGQRCATVVFAHLLQLDGALVEEFRAAAQDVSPAVRPTLDPAAARRLGQAMPRLAAVLRQALDGAGSGSALRDFADDARLDLREKVGVLMLAVIGGWEPLADFVTNSLPLLAEHREDFAASADPGPFEDEFMRLHAPIPIVSRGVAEPSTVGRHQVRPGDRVVVLLAAANRDPLVFAEPDRVRPGREATSLGFGAGTHYCLGAALVRAAAGAVHTAILRNNPQLQVGMASPPWEATVIPRRIARPVFG